MAKPKILQQLNAEKTSAILLASDPSQNMHAATKQYVDDITNGTTFTGEIKANGASSLTTGQARNIYCSTSEPTASDGNVGDIWIVYEE